MEKKLLKNLKAYLEPSFDVPMILFDSNQDRELPIIVLGIEETEIHPVLDCNATVTGFVMAGYRGTRDPTNALAEASAAQIKTLLQSPDLFLAVNAPLSGTDTRPCSGFHLESIFLTGPDRRDEESSTLIFVNWEAFIADTDG